jgi:DNA-directed RNA polymerase specialized sigma24 family protein
MLAFGRLWEKHRESLSRAAHFLCGRSHQLAEEVLAQLAAHLALAKVMHSYAPQPGTPWQSWARKVLQHMTWHNLRNECAPGFKLTKTAIKTLDLQYIPRETLDKLAALVGHDFWHEEGFRNALREFLGLSELSDYYVMIRDAARSSKRVFQQFDDCHDAITESERKYEIPFNKVFLEEFENAANACLDTLHEDRRLAVILHAKHGWTFEKIGCALFGLSETKGSNRASTLYYAGIRCLQECLKEFSETEL